MAITGASDTEEGTRLRSQCVALRGRNSGVEPERWLEGFRCYRRRKENSTKRRKFSCFTPEKRIEVEDAYNSEAFGPADL